MLKNMKPIVKAALLYALILLFSISISIVFYFWNFDLSFSAPHQNWVDTSVYFNNLLSPLLLIITSWLIFLTWQSNKEEIRLMTEAQSKRDMSDKLIQYGNKVAEHSNVFLDGVKHTTFTRTLDESKNGQGVMKYDEELFQEIVLFKDCANYDDEIHSFKIMNLSFSQEITANLRPNMITHYLMLFLRADDDERKKGTKFFFALCCFMNEYNGFASGSTYAFYLKDIYDSVMDFKDKSRQFLSCIQFNTQPTHIEFLYFCLRYTNTNKENITDFYRRILDENDIDVTYIDRFFENKNKP